MGFGIHELFVLLFLLSTILCIVALLDIMRSEFAGYTKLLWLLIVVFFPLLGSLAYLIIGRKQKMP